MPREYKKRFLFVKREKCIRSCCNYAKGKMPVREFLDWVFRVFAHTTKTVDVEVLRAG